MQNGGQRLLFVVMTLLWPIALWAQAPWLINRGAYPRAFYGQSYVRFCAFGDSHPHGNSSCYQIAYSIMRAIALERPHFVLGLGDYVDGARRATALQQQWQRFFFILSPLWQPLPIPLALAPGNHDVGSLFEQYVGRRYFSFDVGPAHIIVLDSQQAGQYGMIAGAQWEWLKADLAAHAQTPLIFVAVHQPLFPTGPHRGHSLDKYPNYRDRLHLLFVQYKVSAVFSGHEHLYDHQLRDGVHYFISGGGGGPLYADAAHGGFYHYLLIECNGSGFTVQVKRLNL